MSKSVLFLIPAYNPTISELTDTLESLAGELALSDICIVDDGSAVPVVSLLPATHTAQVITLERNSGITAALIAGVKYAAQRGYAYVCRLDVGDRCRPGRVRAQMEYMRDNPSVSVVGALSQVTDLEGNPLFVHGVAGKGPSVHNYLRYNSPFKHSTFFARVSSLLELGSYNDRFNGAEDYELLLRLGRFSEVACLDQILIDYVENPAGISSTRRHLQLRKRLLAQFSHFALDNWRSYAGVLRSVATILVPRQVVRLVTLRLWAGDLSVVK
jgi:glycosyltransferase involved in cell wall biosynthesis